MKRKIKHTSEVVLVVVDGDNSAVGAFFSSKRIVELKPGSAVVVVVDSIIKKTKQS